MISKQEFVKKYHNPEELRKFFIDIVDKIEDDRKATKRLIKVLKRRDIKFLQDAWQEILNKIVEQGYPKGIPMELLDALYENFARYTDKIHSKRLGRPPLVEKIPIERIVAAYKTYKTVRKTAKILNMSHPTVSKYLKEAGIDIEENTKNVQSPHTGAVATWLRENPNKVLPPDVDQIANLVGCSTATVKSYLYRKRQAIEKKVSSLPDLKNFDLAVLVDGFKLSTKYLSDYYIDVHPVTLKLIIRGYNNVGTFVEFPPLSFEQIKSHLS